METVERLGCVIQASGDSNRFRGGCKLVSDFMGKPLIAHILDSLPKEKFSKVLVVTRSVELQKIAKNRGFETILHSEPQHADTVRIGISAMAGTVGCMFCVGDQPLCRTETYADLAEVFSHNPDKIVRLFSGETPSSPVIFPQSLYAELSELSGDVGGGAVVKKHPNMVIRVQSTHENETADIDSREDLESLKNSK